MIKNFIEGILKAIINIDRKTQMPGNLFFFLDNLFSNGIIVPETYLTNYEKSRLEYDKFNQLYKVNDRRQRMLLMMFVFTRIVI